MKTCEICHRDCPFDDRTVCPDCGDNRRREINDNIDDLRSSLACIDSISRSIDTIIREQIQPLICSALGHDTSSDECRYCGCSTGESEDNDTSNTDLRQRNHRIYLDYWRTSSKSGEPTVPFDSLTCAGCSEADICEFAFDPYNTQGDCLASN